MKKGRWYLVFVFEDELAHKNKTWITRTEYILLKATDPEAALRESQALWTKKKGKKYKPQEPYEKGPFNPQLVYFL